MATETNALAQLVQVCGARKIRHDAHVFKSHRQVVPSWIKAAVVRIVLALVGLARKLGVCVPGCTESDCGNRFSLEYNCVPVALSQGAVRLELRSVSQLAIWFLKSRNAAGSFVKKLVRCVCSNDAQIRFALGILISRQFLRVADSKASCLCPKES